MHLFPGNLIPIKMTVQNAVLCVTYEAECDKLFSQALADRLSVPLVPIEDAGRLQSISVFLIFRDGCLKLLDRQLLKTGGLMVEIEPRYGEQHSWPAPKKGPFAQAIGKKTRTVIDATAGWAQDGLALFRMGYEVTLIERSPVMAELIADGLKRLAMKDWVQKRALSIPSLMIGNSIEILNQLSVQPDCIYLDPMFPSKRKKSALAKKSMTILREVLGNDMDRKTLFEAAYSSAGKRIVVKSPDYAEPLGGKPSQSIQGKLLRYDVYLKSSSV